MTSEEKKCCPDCCVASRDVNRGHVAVAVPDSCSDDDCACHRPLSVRAGDESGVTARFGR